MATPRDGQFVVVPHEWCLTMSHESLLSIGVAVPTVKEALVLSNPWGNDSQVS